MLCLVFSRKYTNLTYFDNITYKSLQVILTVKITLMNKSHKKVTVL